MHNFKKYLGVSFGCFVTYSKLKHQHFKINDCARMCELFQESAVLAVKMMNGHSHLV